jgi:hypothetical protein
MKMLTLLAALSLLGPVGATGASAAPLDSNLMVSADAETGVGGWSAFADTPMFETVAYAPPLFLYPDAPHGSQLFAGSHSAFSAGWQQVDVGGNAAAIDASLVSYRLSAYLGGVGDQEDNALLYVSFLGATGDEIDHTELGPIFVDLRAYLTVLGGFRTEGYVPVGTRTIQFSLSMDAPDGDSSGAYADNLSFSLASAVPEPQTWTLMAFGLAALATARANRRAR